MSTNTQNGSYSIDSKIALFKSKFVSREDTFYLKNSFEKNEFNKETGELEVKKYSGIKRACANYGDKELCLITKSNGKCKDCSNFIAEPVSDTWIRKHIVGKSNLCLIPITPNGTRLGAIDFDESVQPGLEYVFADAKRVRDYCRTIGIDCYIARSSNKGYHLYFFFDNWIAPNKVVSFLSFCLLQTGFVSRSELVGIKLPEVFPKQVLLTASSTGNGIRVPMSEPDVREGKNCFVDDDAQAYPLKDQWSFLENTKFINSDYFEKMLVEQNVRITSTGRIGSSRKSTKKTITEKDPTTGVETTREIEVQYESKPLPPAGSFHNIISSCPAMQEYWAKDKDGKYAWDKTNPKGLFHHARVASMIMALTTTDGEDMLLKRWDSDMTKRALDSAKNGTLDGGSNEAPKYHSITCKWMQDHGCCVRNKHPKRNGIDCMDKRPPVYPENGKLVVNPDNLPESEWPSPSPIRYRLNNNLTVEDVKDRLALIAKGLFNQKKLDDGKEPEISLDEKGKPVLKNIAYSPENGSEMLHDVLRCIVYMTAAEKDSITSYVLANKWFSKTEWNSKLKAAGVIIKKEKVADDAKNFKSFVFKGRNYSLKDGKIVTTYTDAKGNLIDDQFANCWIERLDEPAKIKLKVVNEKEEILYEDRVYKLIIHIGGQQKPISIPNKVFANSGPFFEAVTTAGGTDLMISTSKESYDIWRNAISAFSNPIEEKYILPEIGYFNLKGGMKYLMPSVVVSSDSIEKNTTHSIDLDNDYTRCLDFKILSNEEFKSLSRHIIDEYFKANNPIATMSVFSQAMATLLIPLLEETCNYKKSPILWWWGGYGGGKTWFLEQTQYFYGDFTTASNMGSTGSFKAKIGIAHSFRHAFSFYDDSKANMTNDGGRDMKQFVQSAYDRNIMPALDRSGENRKDPKRVRGLIAVSAEDPIENESSALSRMITIDEDLEMSKTYGETIFKNRTNYCGFTPYVIKHILNIDKSIVFPLWKEIHASLLQSAETNDKSGSNRICENLTMNYLGLYVALDAMVANGAISREEADKLSSQHMTNLKIIKNKMLMSVVEARGSQVFLEQLRQLLANPIKYRFEGWAPTDVEMFSRSTSLGFIREKEPKVVYLHPEVCYGAVVQALSAKKAIIQSKNQVVRQLFDDGCLVEEYCKRAERRYIVKRTDPNGVPQYVWPLKAEAIGLYTENTEVKVEKPKIRNVLSGITDDFKLQ